MIPVWVAVSIGSAIVFATAVITAWFSWDAGYEVGRKNTSSTPEVPDPPDTVYSLDDDDDDDETWDRDIRLKFCRNDDQEWIADTIKTILAEAREGDRIAIDFTDGGPKR